MSLCKTFGGKEMEPSTDSANHVCVSASYQLFGGEVRDERPDALKGIWFMTREKKNCNHVW